MLHKLILSATIPNSAIFSVEVVENQDQTLSIMKKILLLLVTVSSLLLSGCDSVDCSLVDCPLQGVRLLITLDIDNPASGVDINQVNISSTGSDLLPEISPTDIENTVAVWFKARGTYQLSLGDRLASIEIGWTEVVGDCCTASDLQSFIANGVELCSGDCMEAFTIML